MGKVYLITSGKGGVGKSTLSSSLAVVFARNGKRVLLLDADIGLRCDDLMLDMQNTVLYDYGDILEGTLPENALRQHPACPGLYLLAAPQLMSASEVDKKKFRKMISSLRDRFDLILIDCPAGIGRNMKTTLGCADETILVCTMDDVCVRDAEQVASLLSGSNEAHPSVVFNKADPFLIRRGRVSSPEQLALHLDMPLLGVIPFSQSVARALYSRTVAYECDDRRVYRAIEDIALRMLGQELPVKHASPGPLRRFLLSRRSSEL